MEEVKKHQGDDDGTQAHARTHARTTHKHTHARKHTGAGSYWTVIENEVYDITAFMKQHPGPCLYWLGDFVLVCLCGCVCLCVCVYLESFQLIERTSLPMHRRACDSSGWRH